MTFSEEGPGEFGALDKFCGFERSYFTIAIALVFTYIVTITLTVLRILEQQYTKNTKVGELLESLDRTDDINFKILEMPSPGPRSPSLDQPPPQPPSEGVITRNTSLRSIVTTIRSSTSSHAPASNPCRANRIPRRPIGQPPPPPPLPPTIGPGLGPAPGFVPLPLPLDEEDDAAAAHVADGMQHRRQPSREPQHSNHNHPHPHQPFPRMPMLSEEDQTASAALVSDGMRPEPMLPPYHPGSSRMPGHAGEDNEMRLSEYVKGQTRAQEMKDSGRY
ncbi:hypothetical protein BT67DRAFT_445140 [Trichocladium antarcticum]|uniref:Uncharacterized protein n=1 Tax=Trichocladium antarcticum TaxID=1450529 RepID=A0AAN6UE88_9PEZI|nr:hypothetical protein BT67DRAFT_445140 [Trichocladium antarcticum]